MLGYVFDMLGCVLDVFMICWGVLRCVGACLDVYRCVLDVFYGILLCVEICWGCL